MSCAVVAEATIRVDADGAVTRATRSSPEERDITFLAPNVPALQPCCSLELCFVERTLRWASEVEKFMQDCRPMGVRGK